MQKYIIFYDKCSKECSFFLLVLVFLLLKSKKAHSNCTFYTFFLLSKKKCNAQSIHSHVSIAPQRMCKCKSKKYYLYLSKKIEHS